MVTGRSEGLFCLKVRKPVPTRKAEVQKAELEAKEYEEMRSQVNGKLSLPPTALP